MSNIELLKRWLELSPRIPNRFKTFNLFDFQELCALDDDIKKVLCSLVISSRFPEGLVDDICELIGPERTLKEFVQPNLPSKKTIRRGFFGEALLGELLIDFFNYEVPVKKLQYAIIANETLPRTDLITIKYKEGKISEVCFVESKLRTSKNTTSSVEALQQLNNDYLNKIPEMLFFVLARLKEKNDVFYDDFKRYMVDRKTVKENFIIGLIYDHDSWSETTLENLHQELQKSPTNPVTVNLVLIHDLRSISDEVFTHLGVEIDDDE